MGRGESGWGKRTKRSFMTTAQLVLGLHAFATLSMTGLIWFVQVVHYPLFRGVPGEAFPAYEEEHQRRTTWVVAPFMLVEVGTAVLLCGGIAPGVRPVWAWVGLALVGVLWASTFLVQGPLHGRLERWKEEGLIGRLVGTNWVRTAAWTARGVLAVVMMAQVRRGWRGRGLWGGRGLRRRA